MSLSGMFTRLGAPLKNVRWSWGSMRASDGVIFLRVWQDRTRKVNEQLYVKISDETLPAYNDLGRMERREHTNLVRNGSPCYLIMCEAADIQATPRAVQSFNRNEIFQTGELIQLDGSYWVQLKDRIDANRVIPHNPPV